MMKNATLGTRKLVRFAAIGLGIAASVIVIALCAPTSEHLPIPNQSAAAQGVFKCSTATLVGTFAVRGDGWIPGGAPPAPMVPFATTGRMTLDGAGVLQNDVTVARNGQILRNLNPGTYSVGENCKGTMSIDITEFPFRLDFDLVVNERGNGFYFIGTTPSVVTHEAKRIHAGM